MPRLALSLLGPFEVTLDGEPITGFESDKVRALLVYLAVEADRPHRRQALAGLLWPEFTESAARRNLRNALYNLRQVIGDRHAAPMFLLVTRDTVQFNSTSDHWLDVAALANQLTVHQPNKRNIQPLEQAVALYRGPFLEGFSLKDSPGFEDWSLLVRERLLRQVLEALHCLSRYHEVRGVYNLACEYAHRQVNLEPWQEEAHQRLMRLLALRGHRASALAQYETCCRLLREELGVEPTTETTRLYETIRGGEATAPTAEKVRRHNLPVPAIPLVGRKTELGQIEERLSDPGCRLLTLVGPGGCGKTRLAVEAAAEQVSSFDHGVFFVSLAPLQSADAIVPTIAQALGFHFYTDARDDRENAPRQQLLDYVREKNLLLLLDNFEHLISPLSVLPNGGETGSVPPSGLTITHIF